MTYLHTDQYTHVDDGCPVTTELLRADHCVEVVIGGNGGTMQLTFHDPNVMLRISDAIRSGCDQLTAYLESLDQQESSSTDSVADTAVAELDVVGHCQSELRSSTASR